MIAVIFSGCGGTASTIVDRQITFGVGNFLSHEGYFSFGYEVLNRDGGVEESGLLFDREPIGARRWLIAEDAPIRGDDGWAASFEVRMYSPLPDDEFPRFEYRAARPVEFSDWRRWGIRVSADPVSSEFIFEEGPYF